MPTALFGIRSLTTRYHSAPKRFRWETAMRVSDDYSIDIHSQISDKEQFGSVTWRTERRQPRRFRSAHSIGINNRGKKVVFIEFKHEVTSTGDLHTRWRAMSYQKRYSDHVRWTQKNPERLRYLYRKGTLRRNHGMTHEDFERMEKEQSGLCAICNRTNGNQYLYVDHNHRTGKTRGLLCNRCNHLLAGIEDPSFLKAASEYLERF